MVAFAETDGRRLFSPYVGDGFENEDYHGWGRPLLAPFDGVVRGVGVNMVVNRPGEPVKQSTPGFVEFERADSVRVVYAHTREPQVAEGDTVRAGEVVARIENNGFSYAPHVHIAAWRGEEPLQIRWDLRAMGRLRGVPSASHPRGPRSRFCCAATRSSRTDQVLSRSAPPVPALTPGRTAGVHPTGSPRTDSSWERQPSGPKSMQRSPSRVKR